MRNFEIMPERCVVYGCNNTASTIKGISLYRIPYFGDSRPIAKSRRQKWVSFIQRKRDKWQPSISSVVCSQHFTEESFEYGSDTVKKYKAPKLKRDEIGITAFPSLLSKATSSETELTERSLRMQHRVREKVCRHLKVIVLNFFQVSYILI